MQLLSKIAISIVAAGYIFYPVLPAEDTPKKERPKFDPKKEATITDNYVHQWIPFPLATGKSLFGYENFSYKPERGTMAVLVFLSSWCVPCQKITPSLVALEEHYSDLGANFIYAFAQDTTKDALAFAKEHRLNRTSIIADQELLSRFHNPKLPSIYISDRQTWLSTRFIDVKAQDLEGLRKVLALYTAI